MGKTLKYLLVIVLSFQFVSAHAQRLRYKDIYQVITSGDNVLAYSLLFEYQKTNPTFANTYFQLGLISYYNIKQADPLLEYKKIKYFHYNVHLFWELAEKYIRDDNSEVTRNRKFFLNVPELAQIKKIKAEDVLTFINKRMAEIDEYVKEVDKIYGLFYKMVGNYTDCVDYYRRIIGDYKKLKDLYLAPETEIFPRMDTLKNLFDSTMNMYQLYRAALESYPLKKYNQHLVLRPLTLYRLDGVTNTDFLSDTMLFWDYGKWVRETRNVIATQILRLRSKIELHYNKLKALERKLLDAKKYSDDYSGYMLPTKVIYLIEKYDINSVVSNILKYEKTKTDFLAYRLHKFNDTTDSATKLIVRAAAYEQEKDFVHRLDSLLEMISSQDNEANIHKYKDFFSRHFPSGLQPFVKQESHRLDTLLKSDFEHFKYFVFRDIVNYAFDSTVAFYHGDTIRLYVSAGHLAKYVTMDIGRDPLNNIFVAGVTQQRGTWKVFVAKVGKNNVSWVKTIPIETGYMVPMVKVYPYTDGVVVDINEQTAGGNGKNIFYRFDQVGNKGFTVQSDVKFVPRFIFYDDINGYLVAAYKGLDRELTYSPDSLVIEKWDIGQKHRVWKYSFAHTGDFVNVIRFDSVYYGFVNYKSIGIPGGEKYTSTASRPGVVRITESGQVLGFEPLLEGRKFYLLHALKLTSKKIDLLGFSSDPIRYRYVKFDQLPELKAIIINKF